MPGVRCVQRAVPIRRVGLYIPGGKAPLFSTVLMLAVPARVAGCGEVILCTPARPDGTIAPEILYAADLCGVDRIFSVGGAQAVAAMAYGTESIPRVDKIFGPGNRYVTKAKQLVGANDVAVDLPAGPSEVLVLADDEASPAFAAADLLSQAEHGGVGFSQQKIRGYVKQPCNFQHLLMGQGSLCTADEAADGAFGAAEFLGKFWLADVVLFHQVRKTDVGWCGQIFLCHVIGPPF